MKKDTVQARNRIANLFFDAADRAEDKTIRARLRALGNELTEGVRPLAADAERELLRLAEAAGRCAGAEDAPALERIEAWTRQLLRQDNTEKGGTRMNILGKLFGKKEAPADEELKRAQSAARDAELMFLEQRKLYEKEMTRLEDAVAQAARLEPGTAAYNHLKVQAQACQQKIKQYESLMNRAFNVLSSNTRYADMLESGATIERLKGLLPDPVKADVLLEKLSESAQELDELQGDLNDALAPHEDVIFQTGGGIATREEAAFEAAVAAKRIQNQEQAAQKAAEQAVQSAESAVSAAAEAPAQLPPAEQ